MAYDDYGFSIDDALARSQDVFEVDVTEWGDQVSTTGSVRFPPIGQRGIPSSLAAIAIGPRSTIDHAWVTWSRDKSVIAATGEGAPQPRLSAARYLSNEAPLLYTQRAAPGTATTTLGSEVRDNLRDAMRLGALYVYPVGPSGPTGNVIGSGGTGGSTLVATQYVDQFNAVRLFSTGGIGFDYEPPFLQLTLYLKPPAFASAPKRAPLIRTQVTGPGAAPAPVRIAMLPIYGRKHIRIQALSSAQIAAPPGVFSLYAGLIRNVNRSPLNFYPVFEAPAGSVLANPVGTVAALEITNPNADYLALYVNVAAATSIGYTVVASD
jgi:hypothetical protein